MWLLYSDCIYKYNFAFGSLTEVVYHIWWEPLSKLCLVLSIWIQPFWKIRLARTNPVILFASIFKKFASCMASHINRFLVRHFLLVITNKKNFLAPGISLRSCFALQNNFYCLALTWQNFSKKRGQRCEFTFPTPCFFLMLFILHVLFQQNIHILFSDSRPKRKLWPLAKKDSFLGCFF